MNSSTSTSVEGVVPSLDIIIGADRLSVDAPGTGWKSVGIDPLVVDILPTHEGRGWSLAALATRNSLEFLGGAGKVVVIGWL